jgi:hypothetical protein
VGWNNDQLVAQVKLYCSYIHIRRESFAGSIIKSPFLFRETFVDNDLWDDFDSSALLLFDQSREEKGKKTIKKPNEQHLATTLCGVNT